MSRDNNSLYKSTFKFLTSANNIEARGNALRRLQTLCFMLCSCIHTENSSLKGLSRSEFFREPATASMPDMEKSDKPEKQSESYVKQAKRWLSSKWTDWETFYAPYIGPLLSKIAGRGEMVLIIDGSETAGDCVSLMLSAVWCGFAVPLTWVTRKGSKGRFREQMHLELTGFAKKILPPDCRIVLLGDGEFDGEGLRKQCREWGWEFVLRTSKDRLIDCGDEQKVRFDTLCSVPGSRTVFAEKAVGDDNGVMWHGKGFKDPVFLLTNMDVGQMACAYYKRRFKIEVLFKHMKSNGFNLQKSKICSPTRVFNLLIVVALAFLLIFCAGLWLKTQQKVLLVKIARFDRIPNMSPVVLSRKCIQSDLKTFNNIFSIISKNWGDFLQTVT